MTALSGGAGLRRSKLEARAGSAAGLAELIAAGLVEEEVVDLDGLSERCLSATDEGLAALARAAPAGTKAGKNRSDEGADGNIDDGLAIKALVPWFGSTRRIAGAVGEALRGRAWIGVPFCGSLAEVPAMLAAGASAIACNDKHALLINLARTAAHPRLGPALWRRLRRQPFCDGLLADAQRTCREGEVGNKPDLDLAEAYFVAAWCGRSGNAGTDGELKGKLSRRWSASGGDSALRFARATFSLRAWRGMLERCSFSSLDAFDFLEKVKDDRKCAVYADPPWPGAGEAYLYHFSRAEHERLAVQLGGWKSTLAVVRTGGGKLIERLYPKSAGWRWLEVAGRNQGNRGFTEWLLIKP